MSFLTMLGVVGLLSGFLPALEGPDTSERAAAVDSLAALGGTGVAPLGEALGEVGWRAREGILDALARIGTASLPVLMQTARAHPRFDARRLAMLAMGCIGGEAARDSLLELLDTQDRDMVLKALGEVGDPAVAPAVARFLKDPQINVRRRAVVALGKTGDVGYSDLMIDALSDSHHSVRFAAAGALEALGSAAAGALLARTDRLLGPARYLAIRTLGRLRYRPAADAFKRALKASDWGVRAVGAEALGNLNDRACLEPLEEAVQRETYPFVRERIWAALRALKAQ